MIGRVFKLAFTLTAMAAVLSSSIALGEGPTREYRVKAEFIFNFIQFVEWPREALGADDALFVVAVVGQDPFNGALEQSMDGRSIGGRKIFVKHFASASRIESCQVLFVPTSEDEALNSIKDKVADLPVLTIGESDAFIWGGGIIRFYTEDNKVRFEIDPQAADHARLRVSSKLLKLARIFDRGGR